MPTWLQTVFASASLLAPTLAVYVAWRLRQIHILVNSRLTEALNEIKRLGGEQTEF